MKKIITLLTFIFCITLLHAQDIIITKDSKRIEAKIIEVTSTTIKYKKWTYQDGPDFVEAKSNIAAIMWGNGEVEAFNTEETVEPQPKVEKKQETNTTLAETKVEKKDTTATQETFQKEESKIKQTQNNLPYISKAGNTYTTSDGRYLSSSELKYFLEDNCSGAYDIWYSGELTRVAGWTLLGCGLTLDLISAITYGVLGYHTPTSAAFAITGGLAELACIPTLIVGYAKKNKAINYYNSYCTKQNTDISLNFGVAPNQIGFILNF